MKESPEELHDREAMQHAILLLSRAIKEATEYPAYPSYSGGPMGLERQVTASQVVDDLAVLPPQAPGLMRAVSSAAYRQYTQDAYDPDDGAVSPDVAAPPVPGVDSQLPPLPPQMGALSLTRQSNGLRSAGQSALASGSDDDLGGSDDGSGSPIQAAQNAWQDPYDYEMDDGSQQDSQQQQNLDGSQSGAVPRAEDGAGSGDRDSGDQQDGSGGS